MNFTLVILLLLLIIILWVSFSMVAIDDTQGLSLDYLISIGESLNEDLPDYDLIEGQMSTTIFVPNQVPCITICLRRQDGTVYNRETVIIAFLHELTHLLVSSTGHGPDFYYIEDRVLTQAKRLGLIEEHDQVEDDYPCLV